MSERPMCMNYWDAKVELENKRQDYVHSKLSWYDAVAWWVSQGYSEAEARAEVFWWDYDKNQHLPYIIRHPLKDGVYA